MARDVGSHADQLDVLHLLSSAEPRGATISVLREALSMTQPNVTFVVQALERAGLVRRSPSARDRRTSSIRITTAGKRRIASESPAHMAAIGRAFRGIDATDRARFIEMLATITDGFEGQPALAD